MSGTLRANDTTTPAFPKYGRAGAYHWGKLRGRSPTTFHARLHARYGWFLRETRRRRPHTVIDVGAGDAALAHLLSLDTAARVVAVEPDPVGVATATAALAGAASSVELVTARAEELPFGDRSACVVTLCEVIEHVLDAHAVLAEAARVLADEGAVLLSTPNRQARPADPLHVHEFDAAELVASCARFFDRVDVWVAEPGALVRAYAGRLGRVAVNAPSLLGANPFEYRRRPSATRRGYRQLYALAESPRRGL